MRILQLIPVYFQRRRRFTAPLAVSYAALQVPPNDRGSGDTRAATANSRGGAAGTAATTCIDGRCRAVKDGGAKAGSAIQNRRVSR